MNHLVDNEDELTPRHREVTFSNGAIFAMFFGLVLSWGLFFALGFNLGSHKTGSSDKADASDSTSGPTANFSNFKPAAGSPAGSSSVLQPLPAAVDNTALVVPATRSASNSASSVAPPPPIVHAEETSTAHEPPAASSHPIAPATAQPSPATTSPAPAQTAAGNGSFVVQVAAVSRQDDADLLMSALKAKGYAVVAHSEPQDKLVHIQVGPFNNKPAAEAMRQRLLGDGYNAFIK